MFGPVNVVHFAVLLVCKLECNWDFGHAGDVDVADVGRQESPFPYSLDCRFIEKPETAGRTDVDPMHGTR